MVEVVNRCHMECGMCGRGCGQKSWSVVEALDRSHMGCRKCSRGCG